MLVARWTRNVSGLETASSSTPATETTSRTPTTTAMVLTIDPSVRVENPGMSTGAERRRVPPAASDHEASGRRLFAVDHPRRTEAIRQHAEPGGPEGLLDRHPHRAVFRQGVKYPFGFGGFVDAERHREAF